MVIIVSRTYCISYKRVSNKYWKVENVLLNLLHFPTNGHLCRMQNAPFKSSLEGEQVFKLKIYGTQCS